VTEQDLLLRIRAIVDGAKNVEGLSADLAKLGAQAGKPIADPTQKLQQGLKNSTNLADELAARLGASVRDAVASFAGMASVYVALQKFKEGMVSVIETGGKFESLNISLKTVMGSAAEGDRAFAWIQQFAKDTPLQLGGVSEAFIKLKAFGMDPMGGTLQTLVDQNAKMNGSQETLAGMILAVGQSWTKQKLQAEDANQLIERGVPVWDLLGKVMNKTGAEVMQMSEAGKIGRIEIKGLLDEMGRSAAGAAGAQMKTWTGMVSNLSDNWAQFLDSIARSGALDFMKSKVDAINAAFTEMAKSGELQAWAEKISNAMTGAGGAVASLAKALSDNFDAIKTSLEMLGVVLAGTLANSLKNAAVAFAAWAAEAVTAATTVTTAFAPLVTAIAALAFGYKKIAEALDDYAKRQSQVRELTRNNADDHEKLRQKITETLAATQEYAHTSIYSAAKLGEMTAVEAAAYADRAAKAQRYWAAMAMADRAAGNMTGMKEAEAAADLYGKSVEYAASRLGALKQSAVTAEDAASALAASITANGEKLKEGTKLIDEHYARQTASLTAALAQRLALIDASDANETVKAQQRALAETATNLAKLAEVRRYEAQRLDAINAAYTTEMAQAAQGESQKKQLALATVEARKAAYGDLAKAYAAVVDEIQGQWQREMQLFQAGTEGLKTLALSHEQQILEIRRLGMTEREKLKSQELERDAAIAKYKAEAAKGEQADEKELNRLYGQATQLISQVTEANVKRTQYKTGDISKGEDQLNGLYNLQQETLGKINQQHEANAKTLEPSLDHAKEKLGDMNTALEALDRQLAQAKSLKLEIDQASLTTAQGVIAGLVAPETKTITIQTVAAGAEPAPAEGRRFGGIIAALARGGALSGYGGGDKVPALLEAGEFVVRKEAVGHYGPGLFAALNARKFASGGAAGDVSGINSELDQWIDKLISGQGLTTMTADMAAVLEQKVKATGNAYLQAKMREVLDVNQKATTWKSGIGSSVDTGATAANLSTANRQNALYAELFKSFEGLRTHTYGQLQPDLKTAVSNHINNAMGAVKTDSVAKTESVSPPTRPSAPASTIRLELALPNGTVVPADVPSRFEQDLRAVKRQMKVS
jgi:tape measure domain-containing protein